jgi:ribulose 1,5-bisphosphate carboxylase large subunit-like protein
MTKCKTRKGGMDKAVRETGQKKVHSFKVSAADFDTMIERCEMIVKRVLNREAMPP